MVCNSGSAMHPSQRRPVIPRKLFGPGGLFGPREMIPDPEFHAPPKPAEHAYGPKHVRNTDEWGMIIHTNENGTLRREWLRGDLDRQNNDAIRPDYLDAEDDYVRSIARKDTPLTTAEEIKLLARTLTYGEMMELVAEIWRHSPEKSLTVDTAPAVLWTWATYVYPEPPA